MLHRPVETTVMSETDDIQIDPAICGGKPVLRGTRVAVSIVLGSLAAGMSLQEVADEYGITDAQIRAALWFANERLAEESLHPLPRLAA